MGGKLVGSFLDCLVGWIEDGRWRGRNREGERERWDPAGGPFSAAKKIVRG